MAAGQSKGLRASAPDGGAENDPSTGGLDTLGLLGTNGEEVSRRAVLGAAVAVPLLSLPLDGGGKVGVAFGPGEGSAAPRSASESTPSHEQVAMSPGHGCERPGDVRTCSSPLEGEGSSWHEALAAYRSAEAAVEAAGRVCSAAPRAAIGAAEDAFGDRLEEMYEALRRLLVVPAPDLASFLVKVDSAFEHEIATLAGGEPCVAAIRGDLRRLARFGSFETGSRQARSLLRMSGKGEKAGL